jgi:hypothetical protein
VQTTANLRSRVREPDAPITARINCRARGVRSSSTRVFAALAIAVAASTVTCVPRPAIHALQAVPSVGRGRTKFHLRDGRLVVMSEYSIGEYAVTGAGAEYDANRRLVHDERTVRIPRADIALVETTEMIADPGIAALSVLSAATLTATIACAAVPKACFGSCPTFYVPSHDGWQLEAEGFSTSIARSIAADDLDSLADARAEHGSLRLAMRNEALETHVVQHLGLVVVNGPSGATIYRTHDEHFAAVGDTSAPETCIGPRDGCAALVARDGREFTPGSDGHDLAARTDLTLTFAAAHSRQAGVVLTLRNSLMSTFVLYHLIALHGRHYGEFMAALERRDLGLLIALDGFDRALGEIEVSVRQRDDRWRSMGEVRYVGPIALGVRVVPVDLEYPDEPYEVRLHYARSHWRFEQIAAGALVARDLPSREIAPLVEDPGRFSVTAVNEAVRGVGAGLVTQPGDEVRFRFDVPDSDGSQGLFLRTHGYYYEWMRREWLRDEDLPRARALMSNPREALRILAPQFREIEPRMDAIFEASRYTRQAAP